MAADTAIPSPPDLTNRPLPVTIETDALESPSELRREEIEGLLRDGAWQEAFEEWYEYSDLIEPDLRTLESLDVFGEIDFYWDPLSDRLRFEIPPLPEKLAGDDLATSYDSELADLGQTVIELLAESYAEWEELRSPLDERRETTTDEDAPLDQ